MKKIHLCAAIQREGRRNDHNSLRGIGLRTVLGKVYEGVLNGMVERIDINVGKEQGGFRRGRVCVNLIFCIKNKV